MLLFLSGGYGYLEVVYNVISDNSGWGMYLYGVNSGIARGNLVSGIARGNLVSGNGSGVYIWDNGGVNFERNSNGVYVDGWTYGTLKVIGNEIKSLTVSLETNVSKYVPL